MTWRDCFRCFKSYDAVYAGFFGCRACGHTERVGLQHELVKPLEIKQVEKYRRPLEQKATFFARGGRKAVA